MDANFKQAKTDQLVLVKSTWINLKLGMLSMLSDLMQNNLRDKFPLFDKYWDFSQFYKIKHLDQILFPVSLSAEERSDGLPKKKVVFRYSR